VELAKFAQPPDDHEATVTVLDRDSKQPLYRLLTRFLDEESVTVQAAATESTDVPPDTVLLEKTGTTAGLAVSPFDAVRDELLLVNADIYVTGTRGLAGVETPDVIEHLDELPFTVSGRPDDSKEKLLLIQISRHIEAMAWQAGEGRLATGFQYLSRVDDESGTRRVYDHLGTETGVDAHVYGVPDTDLDLPGVTVHAEDTDELRKMWFVVYQSSVHPHESAALVAVETEPETWEGCWTYDPGRVGAILDYLDCRYD
jgi:hypothetical protein